MNSKTVGAVIGALALGAAGGRATAEAPEVRIGHIVVGRTPLADGGTFYSANVSGARVLGTLREPFAVRFEPDHACVDGLYEAGTRAAVK